MTETQRKWKAFYDWTLSMFYLNDALHEKFNWYFQELFYIRVVSFLEDSVTYINNEEKPIVNKPEIDEWFSVVLDGRNKMYECLSTDEWIYFHYRRDRACHMTINSYDYSNIGREKKWRDKSGNKIKIPVENVLASVERIHNGPYRNSESLDIYLDLKIYPVLNSLREELQSILKKYSLI